MKKEISNIIDGLKGEKVSQFGSIHESEVKNIEVSEVSEAGELDNTKEVDEDEWKTMHGAHILIDTDGDIIAGGPKEMRKNASKSKVSKTFSKDFSTSLDAGKAVKQATGTGRLKWGKGSEKFLDRNQKGIDAIKKSIDSNAKSSDEKSVAKGISKAIDVLNKEMSKFTKSEEKKSGNWDLNGNKDSCNKFYKSLKDLGVDKKQAHYLGYALGLNGGSVENVYSKS